MVYNVVYDVVYDYIIDITDIMDIGLIFQFFIYLLFTIMSRLKETCIKKERFSQQQLNNLFAKTFNQLRKKTSKPIALITNKRIN